MSKISKKPAKGNKKVTDYFTKKMAGSSPLTSSEAGPSQPLASSQATQSSKVLAPVSFISQKKQSLSITHRNANQDVISISSSNAGRVSVSSSSRSHITISSTSPAPDSTVMNRRQTVILDSSSSDIEKATLTAKTSVRRTTQRNQGSKSSRPLKRKFELDSDSDIPLIEKVPYPGADEAVVDAEPISRPPSSPEPASSVPPMTPEDQLLSLPSDDVASLTVSKRARLDPPVPSKPDTAISPAMSGNEADVEDVIPSSQSDEHELTLKQIIKDHVQTRIEVDKWRQGTVAGDVSPINSPSDYFESHEVLMDVDIDVPVSESVTLDESSSSSSRLPTDDSVPLSGGADSQISEAEVSIHLRTKSASIIASQSTAFAPLPSLVRRPVNAINEDITVQSSKDRSLTPPLADNLVLPTTPVALDTVSKTKSLIDAIRANVAARMTSSPPAEAPTFRDELSSDDDLQFDDNFFGSEPDRKHSDMSDAHTSPPPSQPVVSSMPESNRYSLRKRSPVAGPSGEGSSYAAVMLPHLVSVQDDLRRASKKTNPLDALLKEKQRVEKRGGGSEALAAAEATAASATRKKAKSVHPVLSHTEDNKYADEDEAMREVYERVYGKPPRRRSHTPHSSDDESNEDDAHIRAADYKKILGDSGQAVGKIVERDRQGNIEQAGRTKQIRGVPLWLSAPSRTSTGKRLSSRRESLPSLPFKVQDKEISPFLLALDAAVGRSDIMRTTLMLRSETIAMVPTACRVPLFSWLFDLAFTSSDPNILYSIFRTLDHLAGACENTTLLTDERIIMTLIRLGAQPLAFQVLISDAGLKEPVADDRKWILLLHFTSLLVTLLRKRCLTLQEVPNIILSLLKVAFDVTTSPEVQMQIPIAIDSMLASIDNTDAGRLLEAQIAAKILDYMGGLQSINRAYLLSFLNRGCWRNARIARWVAHGCLLRLHDSPLGNYSTLPPLQPLLPILSPAVGSQTAFDILGNVNRDDYFEDLTYNIEILNVALTDVGGYVREEPKMHGSRWDGPASSDSPKEKARTELEVVKLHLDKLHGKIADTRAAHLDRSRAKAALQQLSFRIHYQRQACLRYSNEKGTGKPLNIQGYFDVSTKTT